MVDPDVLWIASLLYQMKPSEGDENERKISAEFEVNNLVYCQTFLGNFITIVNESKKKWAKSGIVKGDDIYKAIATEFGVSLFFDSPSHPWWR